MKYVVKKKLINNICRMMFSEAGNAGVIFFKMEFFSKNNDIRKILRSRLKNFYLTLDSIFLINKGKNHYIMLIGIKSIIGYNEVLLTEIVSDLFFGINLIIEKSKQMLNEKDLKGFENFLYLSIIKQREISFDFLNDEKRNGNSYLYDLIVIPLMEEDKKIYIDYFQRENNIKNFYPIFSFKDYKFALLNLARFDFFNKNLFLNQGDIYRKTSDDLVEYYSSSENYFLKMPDLISNYKLEFYYQLCSLNLNKIWFDYAEDFRKQLNDPVFFPQKPL